VSVAPWGGGMVVPMMEVVDVPLRRLNQSGAVAVVVDVDGVVVACVAAVVVGVSVILDRDLYLLLL